jgi:aspartate/methionine/tyrosine aminotransferase
VTDRVDLSDLYERCRVEGALLLSDECYADVYQDDTYPDGPTSLLQVADPSLSGALVYLSLSKRSGMTGYRSGAVVGDAAAISALKQLRSTTGTASPNFVQGAAIAAWGDDEHAEQRRQIFTAKRRILEQAFTDAGLDIVASRAGLYLWVKVEDDIEITNLLLEHGIVVSPGRFFGPGGTGFIRLALVPALEECAQAAEALTKALG